MWSISPFNSVLGSIQCSRLRVCHLVWLEAQLTVYLGVYLRICSGVYFRVTWRCPLTILGVVLQSALWGALSNSLRADLGVYSQVGWEFTMKGIVTLHESMIGRVYESVLGDIQWSILRGVLWVCHRGQLEAYLRACFEVYLRAYWEM